MAGLTGRASLEMAFVAEEDVPGNLVYPHPRDRLFSCGEIGQLLNRRAVLLDGLMASRTLRPRRNAHHFTWVGHLVAIGAFQPQGDVLLMAVWNRLRRRLSREDRKR